MSKPKAAKILLIVALVLVGTLLLREVAISVFDYRTPQLQALHILPAASLDSWPKTLAEEKDLSKFVVNLRAGPASAQSDSTEPASPAGSRAQPEVSEVNKQAEGDRLKEFFGWVLGQLTEARYLIERVSQSAGKQGDKAAARIKLSDLGSQIRLLNSRANLPELLPVAQMTSALDGLIKQLIDRVENITPSTLRTITGGINLLGELCVPELRADLAANPPIKILVVDDDAVSRFALSAAIKKVFSAPDFADHGEAAVESAARQAYDVIFLDVRMPGMDGFEVCSRIHETDSNRTTPVVFVTGLKDFESQAKSIVSGGSELIGKPFLTFEIAVKALTLVLHARLQTRDKVVADSNATAIAEALPVSKQDTAVAPAVEIPPAPPVAASEPDVPQAVPLDNSQPAFSTKVLKKVSASLAEIRNELRVIGQSVDEAERQKKLITVYLCSQSMTSQLDLPELRPAFQLSTALQGLLKKLQEKPANATASTLETAGAAADVLIDLCLKGVRPDLASTPPISILVVDDEPLARRAIVGALQTAFIKPASVENGEAALALTAQKTFDVIFLDVLMPGMDGYQVCAKIHEAELNRTTPVIFVTSFKDFKARTASARSGGSDFVVKPFLFVEITVKALTFALRHRLQKLNMPNPQPEPGRNIESSVRQSDAA